MDSCIKHPHEVGIGHCGRCGGSWCGHCLVHALGPGKPPYCMSCAMFTGGVRTHADRPALGRRELKALAKQARAEAKAARRGPVADAAATVGVPAPPTEPAPASQAEPATDWSSSWWEDDRQPTLAD